MGELHLDIKVDILKRTYGVELEVGQPQVAYRETITQEVEDSYTHKKQSGGSGQFGKIDYRIKPGEPTLASSSNLLLWVVTYLKEFFPAVEKGFAGMMEEGVLAGFPVAWTLKLSCLTVASTPLTPLLSRLKSLLKALSVSLCLKQVLSCLSQS